MSSHTSATLDHAIHQCVRQDTVPGYTDVLAYQGCPYQQSWDYLPLSFLLTGAM